jgi:L-threonylcarbamoyladenylate synthase
MSIVPATEETTAAAADALRAGGLVAFPTETVYGLGANALLPEAVAKIFAAKERPRFNPLIVHVAGFAQAKRFVVPNEMAERLAGAFWPGALTLVLPRRPDCEIGDLVTAGLDTLAIRAPAHPVAQALLKEAGVPLAAPSANRSGRISPTTAQHVEAELGDRVSMILDGGPCPLGLESTVVALAGEPTLLRLGAVTRKEIERVLGCALEDPDETARPASPGQLASHYAPQAKLRLEAQGAEPGEALLAFGPEAPIFKGPAINLSISGDLQEAATNFFAALRALDASGVERIAVMPIPRHGLGEAINDRLRRAAAN